MTIEQLEQGNETQAMIRALEGLKKELTSNSAPHCLKYGYHKDYLLSVLFQGISEEIAGLEEGFAKI